MKTFVIEQNIRRTVDTTRQYEVEAESKKEALEKIKKSNDPSDYLVDEWDDNESEYNKVLENYHVTDEYNA